MKGAWSGRRSEWPPEYEAPGWIGGLRRGLGIGGEPPPLFQESQSRVGFKGGRRKEEEASCAGRDGFCRCFRPCAASCDELCHGLNFCWASARQRWSGR
ncbi:hypothetical protein NDU88_000152 [Pleurodeles waltl]|uniref:Uncharacterized protein n=1 Tax=Pleurodeles waltl TaxID=8319 RepID=A0AAV7ML65_PLEWA|nr:hypothetical protein NDU88_000152 [Pleurodeles waltl]